MIGVETINTGGSGVNIKKETYHPDETSKIDAGEHNYDHTLLEVSKSENLEEVVSITVTAIDCDIGNNEQSTSVSGDHEVNKRMREHSISATRPTMVKQKQTWYKCSSCRYKSKYKRRLESHSRLKHNENPVWIQCSFCSYKTKNKHSLLLHFKTLHDTDPVWYQCHHCGFETKYKHALPNHIKMIHYRSTVCFQCTFCKFRTVRKSSLKKHVERHKILVCSECAYSTTKKSYLNNHIKLHHTKSPKWYQCEFCHYKTKYVCNLTVHVKRKHNQDHIMHKEGIEWFHCDSCDFRSTSLCYLEFHSKYSHGPTDELDKCELNMVETTVLNDTKEEKCTYKCEFKIDSASDAYDSDVYKDMLHHIEIKPDLVLNFNDDDAQSDHHIDNCDSTIDLTSDSSKIDHYDSKHDPLQHFNANITAQCDYINQSVIETEQQPYVTLNFDGNLTQQEYSYPLLDEELKSFQCYLCGFTSYNQWCLECHIKYTHNVTNDDNPVCYQCCFCSYRTESESSLKSHFHTEHNTNPMWYQCHCCGFGTKYKHHLARHISSHKTACFRCKFCEFITAKESSLKTHVEQHKLLVNSELNVNKISRDMSEEYTIKVKRII